MVKVFVKKNETIDEVIITGHANYNEFGKDIVCSSISSIVITTINGIDKIDDNYLSIDEDNDKLTIKINHYNETCYLLIENMIELLSELSLQYPKNVNVK